MESVSYAEPIDMNEKVCVDCNTSKTPLWRSGPAGPKSLCNACGIRFKKKRSMVGSDKKKEKLLLSPTPTSSSSSTTAGHTTSVGNREMRRGDLRRKLRVNVVAMGKEVVLLRRRQRSPVKRQRVERFGEVEEAAFVLMSLSCGLVFG